MADNVQLNSPTTAGATIATDDIGGVQHQQVKIEFGGDGVATPVSAADPLPVTGEIAVSALPVGLATSANQQTDALTDAELRATPVPISGAGDATSAKQDSQTALLTTLSSLVENLNALVNILLPLGSAMNAGAPALRTIGLTGSTTAVTGSLTSAGTVTTVGSITNFGTGIPASEMAHDINNYTAIIANINNVTA